MAYTLEELQKMGAKPTGARSFTLEELQNLGAKPYDAQAETNQSKPSLGKFGEVTRDISTGFAKAALSSAQNLGRVITEPLAKFTGEQIPGIAKETLTPQGTAEKVGSAIENVAEFAAPAGKVTEATKGIGVIGKTLARAISSGSVASIQAGDIGKETAIAAGVETAIPVAGKLVLKPATKLLSGLFKNIGSAMSGVPSETLTKIASNPEIAKDTIATIEAAGQEKVLRDNINTYINGVSKIRKEAGKAYREGVGALKATDIKQDVFRKNVSQELEKIGSVVSNGERKLTNAEFDNPAMLKKANTLINKLSTTPLDGLSLNRLQNQIESAAFKTTGTDAQRLSFNAFTRDLSNAVKSAINNSTDKLSEINKAYSKDIGLAEGIQNILGNVQFKNDSEIIAISKKLDNLFNQKGLSQEYVDKFLNRIGVTPESFKTSEAVRQISNIEAGANTMGTNKLELIRSLTASIVTPNMVRDAAVLTGKSEQVLKPLLESLTPELRGTLIELLTPEQQ